jgi:molybdopterin biosynthesis enzyme
MGGLAQANCLITVPEDVTGVEAGETVGIVVLEEFR